MADNSDWIEWSGGECPVHDASIVDLRFRNGSDLSGSEAGDHFWEHGAIGMTSCDIVAYRVVSL